MGRVFLGLLLFILAVVVIILFSKWMDHRLARIRQKHLAQFAPGALRHELPPELAEYVIQQGRLLSEAEGLFSDMLADDATLLTTEDADRISGVLNRIREHNNRR